MQTFQTRKPEAPEACVVAAHVMAILDAYACLDPYKRARFERVFFMLAFEEQRWLQAIVWAEQCLVWPRVSSADLAWQRGTTQQNIRMARMRAKRFLRDHAGSWIDGLAQDVQSRQREYYERAA